MALKPYLQLVRLPNVVTAAADSLAGYLLAVGNLDDPARWLPLTIASMAIYADGIVLNDLADLDLDRAERPNRPLPSGRVTLRGALALAVALPILGLSAAALTGLLPVFAVAIALLATVMAYDLSLRRAWVGPIAMSACRGLNVLMGLAAGPAMGGSAGWLVAGSIAVFVAGLTWISRSETGTGPSRGLVGGLGLQVVGLIGLAWSSMSAGDFPMPTPGRSILPLGGLLVIGVVGLVVIAAGGRAVRDPKPPTVMAAVRTGILSLIWLHVGVLLAVRGPEAAAAVAALWLPAFALKRWFEMT